MAVTAVQPRVIAGVWGHSTVTNAAPIGGGPNPASTVPASTSVGATAIHRFLRQVSYRSFLSDLIPAHLRDPELRGMLRRNGEPENHP